MSSSKIDEGRRRALKIALQSVTVVSIGSLGLQHRAWSEDLPHLEEADPTAKALDYVHSADAAPAGMRKDGQYCKNCNLIQSKQGEWRPCSIFPGKAVNENGWCKAWVGRI